MNKAIGLLEYKSIAAGITAADQIVKSAEVDLLEAQTVCPGKYIVLFTGKLSAVKSAVEGGTRDFEEYIIDSFILGNPHSSIFKGMNGTTVIEEIQALGILETYSAASILVAADLCAKTAVVEFVEIRIAKGMCGKSYLLITGEIAAVTESIEVAKKKTMESGMLLNHSVIANPDKKLWETLL